MKTAIIADIHSNLEALQAVLKEIKKLKIKEIYCAGDIVGYGANPNECIELVKKYKIKSVIGNHDLCALNFEGFDWFNSNAQHAIEWTNENLSEKNKDFLLKLPLTLKEENMLMVHGSVENPLYDYVYYYTSDSYFKNIFDSNKKIKILIMGHTHLPFIKKFKEGTVINPGSIGQPRDGNNKASFCVLNSKISRAKIIRISYDVEKTAHKILHFGLPEFFAERLYLGT